RPSTRQWTGHSPTRGNSDCPANGRAGDAGINLIVGHLGFYSDRSGNLVGCLGGAFECAAFGHINDNLKLVLFVDGEHFHFYPTDTDQRDCAKERRGNRNKIKPAPPATRYERLHQTPINPRKAILARALNSSIGFRWPHCSSRTAAHGVTMNAIAREKNIAVAAPIGIGRMYGPINPPTDAMGRTAAMTANVARIVGLPTSLTPSTPICARGRSWLARRWKWRTMFSSTTIASSTRMPMEKIRAKSVMRFRVKPTR